MSAQAVSLPIELPAGRKPNSPEIATAASVLVSVEPAGSPVATVDNSAPAVVIRALDTTVLATASVEPSVSATPTLDTTVTATVSVEPSASVILTAEPSVSAVATVDTTVTATVTVEPSVSPVAEPSVSAAAEPSVSPVAEPSVSPVAPEPISVSTVVYYSPPPVPDFTDSSGAHTPAENSGYISGDETPMYC
jgi:hypothetical protein